MKDEFDPNKQASKDNKKLNYTWDYATYIPDRTPKFKIHGIKGQAITAIKYRSYWNKDKKYVINDDVKLYNRPTPDSLWVEVPIKKYFSEGDNIIL